MRALDRIVSTSVLPQFLVVLPKVCLVSYKAVLLSSLTFAEFLRHLGLANCLFVLSDVSRRALQMHELQWVVSGI